MVNLMVKEGINCIDLYTPNPQVRTGLAKAIKNRLEKFVLQSHLCSIWGNSQYLRTRYINKVKKGFEVMPDEFMKLLKEREQIVLALKKYGFAYVTMNLTGYKTGSMNETLKLK